MGSQRHAIGSSREPHRERSRTGGVGHLMTGRGVLFSGGRQLLIGVAAAAVTFGVGSAVGRAVG
jgi:hypothetical protein